MKKVAEKVIENNKAYIGFVVVSYTLALIIPLLLGQFRWFTGIVINTIFILASLNFRKYSYIPLIFVPSIEKIFGAVVLGIFFPYFLYVLPFIWVGNALYISFFRYLKNNDKMNSVLSLFASSIIKTAVIFVPTFILYTYGLIPYVFLIAMGLMQLSTAIIGGMIALLINQTKFFQKLKLRNRNK